MRASHPPPVIDITPRLLRNWPLPQPDPEGDKEDRGRVLIVGGSREIPGAVLLAAEAALRGGAGKVTIGTCASVASAMAMAVPEARVLWLPETEQGAIDLAALSCLEAPARRADVILIGPGMQDEALCVELTRTLLATAPDVPFILEALAMGVLGQQAVPGRRGRILITPHGGEMAHLTGLPKQQILDGAEQHAMQWAEKWEVAVALKGATTWIADAMEPLLRHEGGNVGLAVSGSGDILAGLIAGLAARGAPLRQACAWAVMLHAQAGAHLGEMRGPLGFLARELALPVPNLLRELK